MKYLFQNVKFGNVNHHLLLQAMPGNLPAAPCRAASCRILAALPAAPRRIASRRGPGRAVRTRRGVARCGGGGRVGVCGAGGGGAEGACERGGARSGAAGEGGASPFPAHAGLGLEEREGSDAPFSRRPRQTSLQSRYAHVELTWSPTWSSL